MRLSSLRLGQRGRGMDQIGYAPAVAVRLPAVPVGYAVPRAARRTGGVTGEAVSTSWPGTSKDSPPSTRLCRFSQIRTSNTPH